MRQIILGLFIIFFSIPSFSAIRQERIQFSSGKTNKIIQSSLQGDEFVDYLINAKAGQTMKIELITSNNGSSFNVFAPKAIPGKDGAIFIGAINGNSFQEKLSASGDYLIRIGLVRSAARKKEIANYKLKVDITGNTSSDAKVAGTKFNATGNIPCSMGNGAPTGSCAFGVVRRGNGSADVTVKKPDGRSRTIFFEKGKAISADISQADYGEFSSSKESDLFIIRIGNERYEIPEAVIFGG